MLSQIPSVLVPRFHPPLDSFSGDRRTPALFGTPFMSAELAECTSRIYRSMQKLISGTSGCIARDKICTRVPSPGKHCQSTCQKECHSNCNITPTRTTVSPTLVRRIMSLLVAFGYVQVYFCTAQVKATTCVRTLNCPHHARLQLVDGCGPSSACASSPSTAL